MFTLSTFIKLGSSTGGMMTLFDTNESSASRAGFSLTVAQNGSLHLVVSGSNSLNRVTADSPAAIAAGLWYHVAVVGSGPGMPVKFYITSVTKSTVTTYTSATLTGANGTYATDANHDLRIGSSASGGHSAFNGQMVDQAIYNRALTPAEIQQLFSYTKKV